MFVGKFLLLKTHAKVAWIARPIKTSRYPSDAPRNDKGQAGRFFSRARFGSSAGHDTM